MIATRRAHLSTLIALCLAWPAPAAATVVEPTDFAAMVAASHTVVRGRVVAVVSQAIGGRRTIESLVTIDVLEAVKGAPQPTVTFRVPGGQIGRYRRITVGAPAFAEGDEVVVFLAGRPPRIPMPFGLSQGVYRVERRGDGRATVRARAPDQERLVRGDPARRPVEAAEFMAQVRALAERQP